MRAFELWVLIAAASAGCGPDFTPQEEIDRLRVLGIKSEVVGSEDVAWPNTVQDALLTPLVTNLELDDPSRFGYAWRVCPVAFGSEADFACVFTEEEFEQLIIDAAEQATGAPIPEEIADLLDVDFDLGTSTTAIFNLRDVVLGDLPPDLPIDPKPVLDQVLAAACEQLQTADFPDFVERPECNGTFQVRIDLTVCEAGVACSSDASPGDESPPRVVNTVRFLDVIYDDQVVPNRNPATEVVCRTTIPPATSGPARCNINGELVEPGEVTELFFEAGFGFELADLTTDDAEFFEAEELVDTATVTVTRQERLTVSWFVTGGGIDRNRTAFDAEQPDNSGIGRARSNVWSTPRAADLDADRRDDEFGIFMVVRDGRGGRAFVERRARLRPFPDSGSQN